MGNKKSSMQQAAPSITKLLLAYNSLLGFQIGLLLIYLPFTTIDTGYTSILVQTVYIQFTRTCLFLHTWYTI